MKNYYVRQMKLLVSAGILSCLKKANPIHAHDNGLFEGCHLSLDQNFFCNIVQTYKGK